MTDEHADGGRPSVSEDGYQMAARIAQRLREAGLKSQILNLMPADTTVLRRDRIVIILALTLLTALAWSYLLWLSADMGMGGMDMTGFRIPSGMGLMIPAQTGWLQLSSGLRIACVYGKLRRFCSDLCQRQYWDCVRLHASRISREPVLLARSGVAKAAFGGSPLTRITSFSEPRAIKKRGADHRRGPARRDRTSGRPRHHRAAG